MPGLPKIHLACVAATLLVILSTARVLAEADNAQLPEGAGKTTVQKVCSGCHAPEIVVGRHETKDGWARIVSSMVDKGANGTDDEFNTIIDYLATHFPQTKSE